MVAKGVVSVGARSRRRTGLGGGGARWDPAEGRASAGSPVHCVPSGLGSANRVGFRQRSAVIHLLEIVQDILARVHSRFRVYVPDVRVRGGGRDEQLLGNLLLRMTHGEQGENLHFAFRKANRLPMVSAFRATAALWMSANVAPCSMPSTLSIILSAVAGAAADTVASPGSPWSAAGIRAGRAKRRMMRMKITRHAPMSSRMIRADTASGVIAPVRHP